MPAPKDPEKREAWIKSVSPTAFKKGQTSWFKGKHHKPESNEKNRLAHLGKQYHLGHKHTEESKRKMSEALKGKPSWMKGKHHTEETRTKLRLANLGQIPWNKGKHYPLPHLKAFQFKKGQIAPFKGRKHTEEAKEKNRQKHKGLWQNEEYAREMGRKFTVKPSTSEKYLLTFLDRRFPHEWKYVGDFKFWIEGRNPDFINVNGKKAVIEYNGHWKHTKEKDQAKAEHYAKYGFKTLNLYPPDLKSETKLEETILEFTKVCT